MSSSDSATRSLPVLSLRAAEIASAAAQKKAQEIGIGVSFSEHDIDLTLTLSPRTDFNIAIVDATLNLLHFVRQPTAKLTSINISIDKAFTAAGHKQPTSAYKNPNFLPGGPAYGIHNSNGGRFMLIGGGVPIVVEGQVVGAVGVSTGTPKQDEEVAMAGVKAVEEWVKKRQGPKL
ncbi:unnamed protein product [Aureobasidium mustum]|uniref:DUF336-domain-containing protein n=1 Tax=Aureobasidium mustum TaxID=2773714 RepID=A0A9N8JZ69_9PEZI|nr:unnamed protein product [Aureobasidium mustum]